MSRIYLKDYMQGAPRVIFYDYDNEVYTTDMPDNSINFDVYEIVMTPIQAKFDKDPTSRNNFKGMPNNVSVYKDAYSDNTLYLYWNDYKSELYRQYCNTGRTDIDLALNVVL